MIDLRPALRLCLTHVDIRAAMTAGPDAAADWALLMANNNPVPALATCRKNITTDAEGHRYCDMPVWLDAPASLAPHS
jgi:hypothetical protein